ncbi:FKBP-like protein [Laetiporus sulphureus 93-53]|uniref:peptidylprolyl isomerase n=1 Tax=Laetiporus sulphureus 93-53 TaxID=1314785 RepID=A0A165CJM7_9APHY|nr:FKBP-like protein [Laetiporus sulphureus 93-53]KZT02932.1 FKBP-like protein [Laetiporus sulphureus 93-53]
MQVEHLTLNITFASKEYIALEIIGTNCICLSGSYTVAYSESTISVSAPPVTAIAPSVPTMDSNSPHARPDQRERKRTRVDLLISENDRKAPVETVARTSASSLSKTTPQHLGRRYIGAPPPSLSSKAAGKRPRVASSTEATDNTDGFASESSATASPITTLIPSVKFHQPASNLNPKMSQSREDITPPGPSSIKNDAITIKDVVVIKDHKIGEGQQSAARGDEVALWYRLQLSDDVTVDSRMQGSPLVTRLGKTFILPAIDQGIVGMKTGGERLITIPPALGYGDRQHGVIPPDSTLFFQCKLLSIRHLDAE